MRSSACTVGFCRCQALLGAQGLSLYGPLLGLMGLLSLSFPHSWEIWCWPAKVLRPTALDVRFKCFPFGARKMLEMSVSTALEPWEWEAGFLQVPELS